MANTFVKMHSAKCQGRFDRKKFLKNFFQNYPKKYFRRVVGSNRRPLARKCNIITTRLRVNERNSENKTYTPIPPQTKAHGLITEFWTFGIFSISNQLPFISPWAYKKLVGHVPRETSCYCSFVLILEEQ